MNVKRYKIRINAKGECRREINPKVNKEGLKGNGIGDNCINI